METSIPMDPVSDPERRFNRLNNKDKIMQKEKISRFIQKYNLGGNVNSVKWKADDNSVKTTFVTPDKSLLGTVKVDKLNIENAEIGVYSTDQLQKLLSVLGEIVDVSLTKFGDKAVSLKVKNGSTSIDYVLSDLSVIQDPPALKKIPDFGTRIKVDNNFINTFTIYICFLPGVK